MSEETKHIDRYSKFSDLEDNSKNDKSKEYIDNREIIGMPILEECRNILSKEFPDVSFSTQKYPGDDWLNNANHGKQLIIDAYYYIGMIDYNIATNGTNISKIELIEMLKTRAICSAALQYFESDFVNSEGGNVKKTLTFPKEQVDISESQFPDKDDEGNIFWCHGRLKKDEELSNPNLKVTSEDIGKPVGDKYYTEDGMGYWTDNEHAEGYVKRFSNNKAKSQFDLGMISEEEIDDTAKRIAEDEGEIIKCNVDIKNNDFSEYFWIFESNGGVPFIFQDEIYKMSSDLKDGKSNIKWLVQSAEISNRKDSNGNNIGHKEAINISNFADFVDWRDKRVLECLEKNNLELPNGTQSYSEYMSYLENKSKIEQCAINISKSIAKAFARQYEVQLKNEDAKNKINNVQQLNNENEKIEEGK